MAYDTDSALRSLSKFSINWILCSVVILTLPRRSDTILSFHKILATAWLFPIALSLYFFGYSKFGEALTFGALTNKNADAFIVLVLIPIFFAMIVETGHWMTRIIGGIGLLLGTLFILLTYSRTGLITLLVSLFISFYTFIKLSNKKFRPIIFLAIGMAIVFSVSSHFSETDYWGAFVEFWSKRIEMVNYYQQEVRVGLMNTAIEAGFSSVFGIGIGNFGEANMRSSHSGAEHTDAHSAYLGFFAETGFLGLLLITLVLVSPLFMFLKLMKQKNRYSCNKQFVPLMIVISGQSVVLCMANFMHRLDDFFFTWLLISLLLISILSIRNTEYGPHANDLGQNRR